MEGLNNVRAASGLDLMINAGGDKYESFHGQTLQLCNRYNNDNITSNGLPTPTITNFDFQGNYKGQKRSEIGWQLYDFSNTTFHLAMHLHSTLVCNNGTAAFISVGTYRQIYIRRLYEVINL